MVGLNLHGGVVRAMTRSAELRATSSGARPDVGMSLVEKLKLLRLAAAQAPDGLARLREDIRQGRHGDSEAVFGSVRAALEEREADAGDPA